ncbi:SAM-dependent DNA methyltransferase, partial [Mammaliicoccus sciuri]|nr:SAM-dependent DNA methyltransferase [Mammaliicoccus sciuri]
ISRFHNLENEIDNARTDKSFLVPFDEIKENDYGLSINKYKEIEYEEIKYEGPEKLIDIILELENEIDLELKELKNMVKG